MPEHRRWEYFRISSSTNASNILLDRLNDLGAAGWEVVGFSFADKTLGINALFAILKREIDPLPDPPPGTTEGWQADPSGRFARRMWSGTHWTHWVANQGDKKPIRDSPTLAEPPMPEASEE